MSDSAWSLCPKLEDRLRYDLPVTVFQPNLTSRVLLKAAESVVSRVDGSILELGCGSGWISRSLIESCNVDPAVVHLSDISNLATSEAESNLENIVPRANIKTGDGLEPWFGSKFGLIINDIAGISDQIAAVSDWYRDIPYAAGTDGLSNSRNILSLIALTTELQSCRCYKFCVTFITSIPSGTWILDSGLWTLQINLI